MRSPEVAGWGRGGGGKGGKVENETGGGPVGGSGGTGWLLPPPPGGTVPGHPVPRPPSWRCRSLLMVRSRRR